MEIRNCTPHPIVVKVGEKELTFPPTGIVPRVGTVEAPAEGINGIPCVTQSMTACTGLPNPEAGVFLLVSALVFGACDRADLVAPDTGKTCIRDEKGRILAVTRLIRREEGMR